MLLSCVWTLALMPSWWLWLIRADIRSLKGHSRYLVLHFHKVRGEGGSDESGWNGGSRSCLLGACLVKTTILETKRRFHNSGKSSQCQILCLLSLDPTDCSSKRCCVTPSQSGDEPTYFKLYIPRHVFSSTPRASTNDLWIFYLIFVKYLINKQLLYNVSLVICGFSVSATEHKQNSTGFKTKSVQQQVTRTNLLQRTDSSHQSCRNESNDKLVVTW